MYDEHGNGSCTTSIPRGCIGLDKHGTHVLHLEGELRVTCSHCGKKVRCWERLSSDNCPPDDWGHLTAVRWLCNYCYPRYIDVLEKFVSKDVLESLRGEGYLDRVDDD